MRCIALSAIAGGLLVAGSATADVSYDLGSIGPLQSVANGGITSNTFEIEVLDSAGLMNIVGFAFEGNYDEQDPDSFSWASDTLLVITTPGGDTWTVGGLTSPNDEDWDFQGSGSDDPGFYEHLEGAWGLGEVDPVGTWTLTFTNDWDSTSATGLIWDDPIFTLIEVPGPGALALLGIAGLAGTRRRR
jgi:hypothetical protein